MRGTFKVALLGVAAVLAQATTILSSIILVRFLSQASYGTYRQAFLIVNTFVYLSSVGIPASLLYFFPIMKKEEQKGILLQTMALLFSFGLTGALVAMAGASYIGTAFHNERLTSILPWFGFYIMFQSGIAYLQGLFMGLDRYKAASISQCVIQLGHLGVIIICVVLGVSLELMMKVLVGYMGVQAVVVVCISLFLFRGVPTSWSAALIKRQLAFTLPLTVSGIVWFLGKEIDKACLAFFFDPAMYAVYVVGALEIPILSEIPNLISSVLLPQMAKLFAEDEHEQLVALWRETIRKSILVLMPAFGILILLAHPMIVILYTNDYAAGVPVFIIYLLHLPMRVINQQIILQSSGRTGIIMLTAVVFVVMNFVLNIIFIRYCNMGIVGPAWATVISYAFLHIIGIWAAVSRSKGRLRDIFPCRPAFLVTLSVLIAYCCAKIITPRFSSVLMNAGISSVIYAAIFCLLAWRFSIFSADDIQMLRRLIFFRNKVEE